MSNKKKSNKAKKNSRASRKVETAKRIEAEKKAAVKVSAKPAAPKPKPKPKSVEAKPVEKKATPKTETVKVKAVEKKKPVDKNPVPKKPKAKVEEPKSTPKPAPAPEPIKKLGEAPKAKPMEVLTTAKILASAALFVVFAMTYSHCVEAIGVSHVEEETTTQEVTTEVTTQETTTEEETTTYAPTQAPTQVYKRAAGSSAPVAAPKSVMLSVPYVSQLPSYPTGCEAASATMLLRYWGYGVSLDSVINAIPTGYIYEKNGKPYGPSIYSKFVGDPRSTYTDSKPGYGAFSPVVTGAVGRFLGPKHTVKNITGSSLATLCSYLDKGCPMIVWATYNMKQPTTCNWWYIEGTDQYFEYPRGTHVFVLCGYTSGTVSLMDPYGRGLVTYSQSAFSSKYNLLGCQAIVVEPVEETTLPPTTTTTTTTTTATTTTTTTTTEEDSSTTTTTEEPPTTEEETVDV